MLLTLVPILILGWWLGSRQRDLAISGTNLPSPRASTPSKKSLPVANSTSLSAASKPEKLFQAERYAVLVKAAAQGDADAAYQLAQGMEACRHLRNEEWLERARIDAASASGDRTRIAHDSSDQDREDADDKARLEAARTNCVGDENASLDQIHDAWALAARLGSREAQYAYALDPHLNPRDWIDDAERWRDWRDTAVGYLDAVLESGDARAAMAFAAASDRDTCHRPTADSADKACASGEFLGYILPQDATTAYRYYVLAQLLGDTANAVWVQDKLDQLAQTLSPAQIQLARIQAEQLYSRLGTGMPAY